MFFITTFFSTARHVLLSYVMKNNSSSTNEGLILDQCNGKIKLITLSAVHLELITKSSHQGCSMKKGVLKISQNSQEKTCTRVIF